MPEYTYSGPGQFDYPASRDARGRFVGEVSPGHIRDLDEPLDQWWIETTDEDRARRAALQGDHVADEAAPDGTAAEDGAPGDGGAPDESPAGSQPANPAVILA